MYSLLAFPQHNRTHMQDLQEVTQDLHYENFRSERLKRGGRLSSHGYILPLSPAYVLVCQLASLHLPLLKQNSYTLYIYIRRILLLHAHITETFTKKGDSVILVVQ